MSDIRINALATTATASASDDYVAIDGSANGTRKLSAYSPTFGGNLTVSGTGTIGGNLTVSSGSLSLTSPTGSAATFTNTTDNNWSMKLIQSGGNELQFSGNITGNSGPSIRAVTSGGAAYAPLTVDGSTATIKILGVSALAIDGSKNGTLAGNLTVSGGTVTSGSGTLTLNSSANTVVLQSAGTTALTLDASQNATFAGRVTAGTAYGTAKSIEVNEAFVNQAQNTTKTVTVALPGGANGATFVLDVGAYGNSGTGYGSLLVKGAGYLGSSTTYDAAEIVKANSGSVTVSSVTKGNNQLTFTVINTAGTVSISVKLTATAGDNLTTIPAITIA